MEKTRQFRKQGTQTSCLPSRRLLGGKSSARDVKGRRVQRRVVLLRLDPRPLTYGDRRQELSGRLVLASGAPATDYTMLVFPVDKAYWIPNSRRIRTARPGTNGEFTLSGRGPLTLPPGD